MTPERDAVTRAREDLMDLAHNAYDHIESWGGTSLEVAIGERLATLEAALLAEVVAVVAGSREVVLARHPMAPHTEGGFEDGFESACEQMADNILTAIRALTEAK